MENLIEVKNRIKNVFDGLDLLEIKGKSQATIVTQMATLLYQSLELLEKEIKEMEEKK